ncbi:hypothetical protein MFRU_003g00640 [Monilinia fructicola]|nr:hypothetical protein MFRU_003g00640 [Monilinia fructicola]
MVNHVNYTKEEKEEREAVMGRFLGAINFTQPAMSSPLSLDAFKAVIVESYTECKKSKDPDAFAPSRSRLQCIYNDKMALSNDPKAVLHKPEDFCGTEATWKHDMKTKYLLRGTQVHVSVKGKDGVTWQELVPLEEYFSIFAQSHLDDSERHCGRDKTYKVSAAGERQGLSKKLITALINRCGCFKKREREGDEGAEERPARRRAGIPAVATPSPPPPASASHSPAPVFEPSLPNSPPHSASPPDAFHSAASPPVAFHPAASLPFAFHPAASLPFASPPIASPPIAFHPAASHPAASPPAAAEGFIGFIFNGSLGAQNSFGEFSTGRIPQAPQNTIDPRLLL